MVKDEIARLAAKLAARPETKKIAGMHPMGDEAMPGFPVKPADWARFAIVWAYYLAFLNIAAPPTGFHFAVGALRAERVRRADVNFLGVEKDDFTRLAAEWAGLTAGEAAFVFDNADFFDLRPHGDPGL